MCIRDRYLDDANPVTLNYNNAGGYVYLYLNFKDYASANKYFANYYSVGNPDNVEDVYKRQSTVRAYVTGSSSGVATCKYTKDDQGNAKPLEVKNGN